MKNLDYKDNELEIKFLLKLLKNLSPTDDTYQYLMNELLIYVYTSYENFLNQMYSKHPTRPRLTGSVVCERRGCD